MAIYARISRKTETNQLNPDHQVELCRALAEQHQLAVADVYVDRGRSAFTGKKRPEYDRMTSDLKVGRIVGLLAWHPDRFTRHPRELEEFIDLVGLTGAYVITHQTGDGYDLATPAGRLHARTVGGFARYESEHKQARLREKAIALVAQGKMTGAGKRPYGYERYEKGSHRLEVRAGEAVIVRDIVGRVLSGESLLSIVRYLNDTEVPAASGGRWTLTSLSGMLHSPRLAGLRVAGGKLVPAAWPGIITASEHEAVQVVLRPQRKRSPRTYLLTGLVHCGDPACGGRMVGRPSGAQRHPHYCCLTERGGCNKTFVLAEPVEELAAEAAFAVVDSPAFADRLAQMGTSEVPTKTVDAIRKQQAVLDDLEAHLGAGELQFSEYQRVRDLARLRLDKLRAGIRIDVRPRALHPYRERSLRAAWASLSLGQRRAVLDALECSVVVDPVRRGGVFDPDRVHVDFAV